MIPAPRDLREGHAHILQLGRSLSMADLASCASPQEMLDRIADAARKHAPDAWVLAHGARPEGWDRPNWPSASQLDRASGGRPVCAWCFDYHALVANEPAMTAAGIGKDSVFDHGRVVTDAAGEPSGLLLEEAALKLWGAVPEPTESERPELLSQALEHLAGFGFVEVHDMKAQPWLGHALADLERRGELPTRVRLYALLDDIDELTSGRSEWESDRVRMGGGKIFTDGTLNSRTAWMIHEYADAPADRPRGLPMMTPKQIEDAVRRVDAMGLPLAAHAIGDGAVRATLDAIERVGPTAPGFRVEHAELIDQADISRFAQLGVLASVQPCHLLPDIEALRRAVPHRLDRVLPVRDLIESGLEPGTGVVFGSDVPIVGANPKESIQGAVHRRRKGMLQADSIGIDQAIDEQTAWACFAPESEA